MFYVSLMVTPKAKTFSRFTKNKERGIRVYHHGKLPIHKVRQKERKKGTMELQNIQKAINKMTLVCP